MSEVIIFPVSEATGLAAVEQLTRIADALEDIAARMGGGVSASVDQNILSIYGAGASVESNMLTLTSPDVSVDDGNLNL